MASCPSCGVAVVPGYVKCPKCGTPLPALARTRSNTFGSGGGTAVADGGGSGSRSALMLALGAGAAIAIVLVIVLGGGGGGASKTPDTTTTTTTATATDDDVDDSTGPAGTQPDEPTTAPSQPTGNDADARAAAADLERELKRQRLWGTASVVDQRVDVRSGSCEAKDMGPLIESVRPRLQGAGLTKLRCLAQSGAVVFERDL